MWHGSKADDGGPRLVLRCDCCQGVLDAVSGRLVIVQPHAKHDETATLWACLTCIGNGAAAKKLGSRNVITWSLTSVLRALQDL
jgi:hypothetical protein